MTRLIVLCLLLSGCSSFMPTRYGEMVYIVDGPHKGERGRLIKDCKGFENYQIELLKNKERVCVKIWNLERLYW